MRRVLMVLTAAVLTAGCGGGADEPATWTAVPAGPLAPRHSAVAVWVGGRFVVVGGRSGPPCPPGAGCAAPAEPALRDGAILDPAAGTWTRIAAAPVPVAAPGSAPVVVGDRVYLLTGTPAAFLSYDPATDRWQRLRPPPVEGGLVAAGETVLVVPFQSGRGADAAFDPRSGSWRSLPRDPLGPSFDRFAVPLGDRVLLTAKELVPDPGADAPALVRLAALDTGLTRWSELPDSEIIGTGPVAAAGRVVWPYTGSADGGGTGNWGRSYPEGGILDPATGSWQPLPAVPWPAQPTTCCAAAVGDRVLVDGHLLQPATREWTRVPPLPGGVRLDAATTAGPDLLLVWGGATENDYRTTLATGYLLRP
ncbi:MAG TPA: hypothetical protein VE547_01350 [Mycobacteriales bacterium]|nr:hypothetical protein [Mycobacteriales bacterium]